jgi:UDP-N-acetylglucosamine 2-epimerase
MKDREQVKIKKLIIITEKAHVNKLSKYIDKNTTVIGWNREICQELERRKIRHKPLNIKYDEDIGIKWIKNLAKKNISEGKNLISLFEFKGASLWWWMEYWLYRSVVYYDSFNEVIKVFYTIYDVIKKEKPDEIVYIKEGLLYDKTIRLIAKNLGIRTKGVSSYFRFLQFRTAKKTKMILIKIFLKSRFISRKIIFNFMSSMWKRRKVKEIDKNTILLIYRSHPRSIGYIQPILKELKNTKYDVCALDISTGVFFINLKVFKEKIKDSKLKHILLEDYISRKDIKYINRLNEKFKNSWNSLKNNQNLINLFEFNGINIWKLVENQFSCYFDVRLKDYLINLIGIDNVIKSLNPTIAVTPSETTEFEKGLFLSCQKNNIPVIAIQHGILTDLRCFHEKNEVSLNEVKPEYCPIPTITAVYGESDKDFLIEKGNYPRNSVVVTGNQRYDPLAYADKLFNKEKICSKLKINPYKKIVVFATRNAPSIKFKEILTKTVCGAFQKLKDVQLIIKVHPNENIEFYREIVKNYKIDVRITKEDIFQFLYICDGLVISGSTVGMEAVILGKPVINLMVESNYGSYVKEGVAIEAKSEKGLVESVKKVLYDKKTKENLTKNRKKYVFNHNYKIDGKASERIVKIITNTIRGNEC